MPDLPPMRGSLSTGVVRPTPSSCTASGGRPDWGGRVVRPTPCSCTASGGRPDPAGVVGWPGAVRRCPRATRLPSDGSLPESALAELGTPAVRVSTSTCRSARCGAATATSTPTRPPSSGDRARRLADDVRRGRDRGDPAGAAGARRPRPARSPRSSSAAVRRPCSARATSASVLAAIGAEFGLAPGAEVTTEANPDSVAGLGPGRAARGRLHPDLASGCSRPSTHVLATLDRTHDPLRVPAVVAWAREAGFDAGQPRPDLRHAGGVAGRLGDVARGRAGLRARPRLGVLAHRRGRAPPWPGGSRAASCRCPTRTTSPTSTSSPTSGSRRRGLGWYEVSNWARDDASALPAQPPLLDRRPTGGASARARTPTWAACAGGTSSTPRRTPSRHRRRRQPGRTPARLLDAETRRVERVLLELRLRDGLPVLALDDARSGRGRRPGRPRAGRARRPSGWC